MALNSDFTDFEDGLQYFTSKEHNVCQNNGNVCG
jgi:hypothetical protein